MTLAFSSSLRGRKAPVAIQPFVKTGLLRRIVRLAMTFSDVHRVLSVRDEKAPTSVGSDRALRTLCIHGAAPHLENE